MKDEWGNLEDVVDVDSPGDLTDENWSDPLGTQLLVHTQEVDLHHQLTTGDRRLLVVSFVIGG